MTPELYVEMMSWLESDDEVVRRHAAFRLSQPDAAGHEKPSGWRSLPVPSPSPLAPLRDSLRGVRLGLRSCLYSTHEGCGCAGAHCHHLARVVTLNDCLDCLPPPKREI